MEADYGRLRKCFGVWKRPYIYLQLPFTKNYSPLFSNILEDVTLGYMWFYVYILELNNGKHYVGCTANLKERYSRHSKGHVPATKTHLPLKLIWCCSFPDRYKAYEFERYLKSGSGRAFAAKHLFKAS